MFSSDRISQRFNMFYDEIDTQMSRLQNSDSIFSQISTQSDDAKLLSKVEKGEISMKDVDDLIKSANEFDEELQNYIEKNNLRRKVAQRKVKTQSMKSKFPPIWNDFKLNNYIDSIIDEVLVSCDDSVGEEAPNEQLGSLEKPKAQISVMKPILKTEKSKSMKRNVATNVKFQIHPLKSDKTDSNKQPDRLKKTNKKIQTTSQNYPQFKLNTASGTLFPCRSERLTAKDRADCSDETLKKSTKSKETRPLTAPSRLKYSPMTVTSTAGRNSNVKKMNVNDDNVDVFKSSLATTDTKQMTTQLLPVLSIKGSCSIQKIYQLEILPSTDGQVQPQNDDVQLNTKYEEFIYEPLVKPSIAAHHPPRADSFKTSNEIPQPSVDVTVEEENRSSFFDIRDVNKILNDHGIRLHDGKFHVVVENSRRRKSNKKSKSLRILKPSTLRKSIDELETTQIETGGDETTRKKKINICNIPDGSESKQKEEEEKEINEKDSSMSSSITDDGKIRQILKINRDGERKSPKQNSSSGSYPESSLNVNTSAQQTATNVEREVSENFESIYKLIEDTFQSNAGTEAKAETNEKVEEIDDGMNEMREVIKMSEENIQRAGMMLHKYQQSNEPHTSLPAEFSDKEDICEKSVKAVQDFKAASTQFSHQEIQTHADVIEIDSNFKSLPRDLSERNQRKETVDSCAQTSEDKIVQTDENLNWKSNQYFGSIYEKYSNFNHIKFYQATSIHNPYSSSYDPCNCVGCERKRNLSENPVLDQRDYSPRFIQAPSHLPAPSSFHPSSKLSVPYNSIYSDDDEVMKAANKFLRSVEKRKNRNADSDITSSEISSSNGFSPQKLHSRKSSSSISTQSSSLLNNVKTNDINRYPVPRARNNLQVRLQKAAEGITSIEQRLEDIQSFTGETQSAILSLSPSPQFDLTVSPENHDLLERYLSEGEVLSQGEIQFRLSDDDDVPDNFF